QDVALYGQAHSGQRHHPPRRAGYRNADLARADEAACRFHALHAAILDAEARHLAVLDNIDACAVRAACVTPGDTVMARGAGPALQEAALDREARIVEI